MFIYDQIRMINSKLPLKRVLQLMAWQAKLLPSRLIDWRWQLQRIAVCHMVSIFQQMQQPLKSHPGFELRRTCLSFSIRRLTAKQRQTQLGVIFWILVRSRVSGRTPHRKGQAVQPARSGVAVSLWADELMATGATKVQRLLLSS